MSSATVANDALYTALRFLAFAGGSRSSEDDVASMKLVAKELDARKALRPADRREIEDVLLRNGHLAEAEAARQFVPSRRNQPVPTGLALNRDVSPGEPRAWRWDAASNVLSEQAFDLNHGAHVVVISSFGCEFCEAFASALPQEPGLARAFAQHGIWITRPDQSWQLETAQNWNRRHPSVSLLTAFDLAGWPHPDRWSTPWFYFVRDGQVMKLVRGYRPEAMQELREGFRAIGGWEGP
jgi:hypothetical protein